VRNAGRESDSITGKHRDRLHPGSGPAAPVLILAIEIDMRNTLASPKEVRALSKFYRRQTPV